MTSVDSNFNFLCGRQHGAGPPSPVHMRPPEPDPPPPPCGRHKWMAPNVCRVSFLTYRWFEFADKIPPKLKQSEANKRTFCSSDSCSKFMTYVIKIHDVGYVG